MRYIRTKDGIFLAEKDSVGYVCDLCCCFDEEACKKCSEYIIAQADTIGELCDEFVVEYGDGTHDMMRKLKWAEMEEYNASLKGNGGTIHGAIWTDKGLIYVAKMNEKGELELL